MATKEVLMLEAPPSAAEKERWRPYPDAELVDALPYIDDDYSNPRVKAEVDLLVEEVLIKTLVDFHFGRILCLWNQPSNVLVSSRTNSPISLIVLY
jgi:Breast carcinoma amplified sequence 2 (BCAS2)